MTPAGGAAGSSAAAAGGAAGYAEDTSRGWNWTECGAIPSTEVVANAWYEPRTAIAGGHPFAPRSPEWGVTGLAMSADGRTLVSAGRVLLAWLVAEDFSSSQATVIASVSSLWPKVDVSPDGRWIAVSGDGRTIYSRDGEFAGDLRTATSDVLEVPCFPVEFRFSPDGSWFGGVDWDGSLTVFRTADLGSTAPDELRFIEPVASIPQPCRALSEAERDVHAYGLDVASSMRSAFSVDGSALVTESGSRYSTADFGPLVESTDEPLPHGVNGSFEISARGRSLISDCTEVGRELNCFSFAAPFPKLSVRGNWVLAGGTLKNAERTIVLDPSARVGIFAPNDDVVVASADNTLTRYCRLD